MPNIIPTLKPGDILEVSWDDAPNSFAVFVEGRGKSCSVLTHDGKPRPMWSIEADQIVRRLDNAFSIATDMTTPRKGGRGRKV